MKLHGNENRIPAFVRNDIRWRGAGGFTLIEILLAIFILAIVLSTIYAAYTGTFRIIKSSEYESDIYAMARTTMDRMIKDLGAIAAYKGKFEFVSKRYMVREQEFTSLSFKSTGHIEFGNTGITAGIATISYIVEEDTEKEGYTLLRYDTLFSKPEGQEAPKGGFVLCDKLHSLLYKFYDAAGKDYDTWDSSSGPEVQKNKLPSIVAIYLNLVNPDDQDHPYKFMTEVYFPVNRVAP